MAIFKLHRASKSFGPKEVINDIFFSLETGEIIGLFGRNGCGKSTLLKIIFGSLSYNNFDAVIDGEKYYPSKNIQCQQFAYLPQQPFLPKNLKVRDVIPIYFSEEKEQDTIFYVPFIAKLAAKKVGELSLGEARYFEVLLLANLPHPFLLLDEPFSMIEPLYKEEIKKYLEALKMKKGILITDHYYDDVLQVSNKNFLIKDGLALEVKTKENLKELEYLGKNFT